MAAALVPRAPEVAAGTQTRDRGPQALKGPRALQLVSTHPFYKPSPNASQVPSDMVSSRITKEERKQPQRMDIQGRRPVGGQRFQVGPCALRCSPRSARPASALARWAPPMGSRPSPRFLLPAPGGHCSVPRALPASIWSSGLGSSRKPFQTLETDRG